MLCQSALQQAFDGACACCNKHVSTSARQMRNAHLVRCAMHTYTCITHILHGTYTCMQGTCETYTCMQETYEACVCGCGGCGRLRACRRRHHTYVTTNTCTHHINSTFNSCRHETTPNKNTCSNLITSHEPPYQDAQAYLYS